MKEWKKLNIESIKDLSQLKVGTEVKINGVETAISELSKWNGKETSGFYTKDNFESSGSKAFWGIYTCDMDIYITTQEWKLLSFEELKQLKKGDKIKIRYEENELTIDANSSGFHLKTYFMDDVGRETIAFGYSCGYTDHLIPVYKLIDIKQTEETNMTTKQFTKKDLKTGHRLKLRDGRYVVYLGDVVTSTTYSYTGVYNSFEGTYSSMTDSWGEDLLQFDCNHGNRDLDIVAVYSVQAWNIINKDAPLTLVWEREAPKSKEQIAYDEALEATDAARQAYELAQKKLEALNPSNK